MMTDQCPPLLELRNVGKSYPAGDAGAGPNGSLEVLTGANMVLNRGESVAILGASGCGKSTLLNIAGALDTPTRGEVLLEGVDPVRA